MSPSIRTLLNRSFNRLTERKSVDFPQPLGPISAVTLPFGTAIEMSWRACFCPYQSLKLLIWTTGSSWANPGCTSAGNRSPRLIAPSRSPWVGEDDGAESFAAIGVVGGEGV